MELEYDVGDVVQVSCNKGYYLQGDADAVCGPEGAFLVLPVCVKGKFIERFQHSTPDPFCVWVRL